MRPCRSRREECRKASSYGSAHGLSAREVDTPATPSRRTGSPYQAISDLLDACGETTITLRLDQVEAATGRSLPPSAWKHPAWWFGSAARRPPWWIAGWRPRPG